MTHTEKTTIGKYSSFDEANRIIYWLAKQNYPTDELYIRKMYNKKKGFSLGFIATLGGIIGLGMVVTANNSTTLSLIVFGGIAFLIIAGLYSYKKAFSKSKRKEKHKVKKVQDCYLLKAETIEDAKMIKTLLGKITA
ncbi:MAG: hypothetical protein ACPGJS_12205 [Flammeovirgaceae bacterium]